MSVHSKPVRLARDVLMAAVDNNWPKSQRAFERLASGSDPTGAGEQIWQILDQLRKAFGKASVADTLFSVAKDDFDFDGDGPREELTGQTEIEIRDGREVPPPSGEEVLAERAEAKAAKPKPTTEPFNPGGAE